MQVNSDNGVRPPPVAPRVSREREAEKATETDKDVQRQERASQDEKRDSRRGVLA